MYRTFTTHVFQCHTDKPNPDRENPTLSVRHFLWSVVDLDTQELLDMGSEKNVNESLLSVYQAIENALDSSDYDYLAHLQDSIMQRSARELDYGCTVTAKGCHFLVYVREVRTQVHTNAIIDTGF